VKRLNSIGFTFLAVFVVSGTALAVAPPALDRPTPPACCADGICYPKPNTFGWYERRWRQWPTEALAPTPDRVTPPGVAPDVPPFDLPPVEEEDRRAPPPTMPPEPEDEDDETVPGAETPPEAPLAPPPGRGTFPTTPLLPFEDDAPGTEPSIPMGPPPLGEPATEPPPGLPFGPMGDLDPPPAPTFGAIGAAPATRQAPAIHAGGRPEAVRPAAAPRRRVPTNDPPPSLPLSLARIGY